MKRTNQRGVALVLTMILVAVLAVMAVSLMFLSQSESWSTMNYRLMSQARDAAEAGVNKAANFIIYDYTVPTPNPPGGGSDPITGYNITVSPVQNGAANATGHNVGLTSAQVDVPSYSLSYPDSSVQTSFHDAFGNDNSNTLYAGTAPLKYGAYAELLAMRQVKPYGSTQFTTIQTWKITGSGSIAGVQDAKVEVSAIMEKPISPTFNYAAFGESDQCGALNWGGSSSTTGSYDSTNAGQTACLLAGTCSADTYGGNVGTNGNLTEGGGATINGSLSTPRTGAGNCSSGAVTAETLNGGATVTGGLVELSQEIIYPPPDFPTPTPPGTTNLNLVNTKSCNGVTGCHVTGNTYTLDASCPTAPCGGGSITYPEVAVAAGKTLVLTAGVYVMDSLSLGGGAIVQIDASLGPVVLEIAGCQTYTGATPSPNTAPNCSAFLGTPVDLSGGSISNASLNPMNFQIQYRGDQRCLTDALQCNNIKLAGGAQSSALVNGPYSSINFAGGGSFYGAVIGQYVKDTGGADIYYDRQLQNEAFTIGNWMLQSFTWKKY